MSKRAKPCPACAEVAPRIESLTKQLAAAEAEVERSETDVRDLLAALRGIIEAPGQEIPADAWEAAEKLLDRLRPG